MNNPFEPWPKIPRLNSECTITEKIDGTNAQILILDKRTDEVDFAAIGGQHTETKRSLVFAFSRKKQIWPGSDNFGFASWVYENAQEIESVLGFGRHFGEWWGQGVQRGYRLKEKRFSLFDSHNYDWLNVPEERKEYGVEGNLFAVPQLWKGKFSFEALEECLEVLREEGSIAAPGYDRPEGVVVYFRDAHQHFKVIGDKPSG